MMRSHARDGAMMFVVDALAAYRITRLITEDTITAGLRDRVRSPVLRKFVNCPWCVGFWVSCGVVTARTVAPRTWAPVATAFALGATTGVIAENWG